MLLVVTALFSAPRVAWAQGEEIDDSDSKSEPVNKANQPDQKPQDAEREEDFGLFGPIRLGPSAALTVPHIFNFGIDVMYENLASVSVAGGRYRRTVNSVDVEMRNWEIIGRWFPWHGSFFVGGAYGQQGLTALAQKDVSTTLKGVDLTIPTTLRLEVTTSYFTPQVGWMAIWDSGFLLGFDFGYQVALSSSANLQVAFQDVSASLEESLKASAEYQVEKKKVEDAAENFGKKNLPYITLLRMGCLF